MTAWRDLLALPFERADCWAIACLFNARRGVKLPDLSLDRPSADDADVVTSALVEVQDSVQVGDVLLSDPTGLGYASHVAVVVEPGWALTTSKRHGPRCVPLHRTPRTFGVWRVRAGQGSSGETGGGARTTGGDTLSSGTRGPSGSRSGSSASASKD